MESGRKGEERGRSEEGEWKEGGREREESEDGEWKEGGREREEQGWREKREKESTIKRLTILFTVSFVND